MRGFELKLAAMLAAIAVSLTSAADPSTAEPPTKNSDTQARAAQQLPFESLDRNGDHQISRTEAGVDKHLLEDFAYIDTDGDGYISPAEYAARNRS
jgi:hypothetical protein